MSLDIDNTHVNHHQVLCHQPVSMWPLFTKRIPQEKEILRIMNKIKKGLNTIPDEAHIFQ
jgi:hypothetical protein